MVAAGARADVVERAGSASGVESVDLLRRTEDLANYSVPAKATGVIVVGGDPELAAVVWNLHRAGRVVPVALVPDRASDLLRMFGLGLEGMLARLDTGTPYRSDLGVCTVGSRSIPFVAHVEAAPRWSRWRTDRVEVTMPRRTVQLMSWRLVAANAQHLAGHTVAPRAAVMDGVLDLQVFGGGALGRSGALRRSRVGLHLAGRDVWRRQAPSARIACSPAWRIRTDGVSIGSGGFEVRVVAGAFDLWV